MVFPGADYSRFSHCLGVCHVTGRILDALNTKRPGIISPAEQDRYRLAGLLHDVGHYPFSHATEDALKDHFSAKLLEPASGASDPIPSAGAGGDKYINHEKVGILTLREDAELNEILAAAEIKPEEVYSIFARQQPTTKFANLISSDLDADRIDYLMRTARHTGLPYGAVDLEYLLAQLCLDSENLICVHPKALRAVEHFLLARYFDYQQVSYHKTVAGLELVLKDVIRALLSEGHLKASGAEIEAQIKDGTWASVDDAFALQLIRKLEKESLNGTTREKARAILERRPPKLVAAMERFATREVNDRNRWSLERKQTEEHKQRWAAHFGLAEELWYVWHKSEIGLTKIGPHVSVSELGDGTVQGKAEQLVRVLVPSTNSSIPIVDVERSLMHVLAKYALCSLRVYVVLPPSHEGRRAEIEKYIRKDLEGIAWI